MAKNKKTDNEQENTTEVEVLENESNEDKQDQLNGLEKLQQQAKESQDNYLRVAADMENQRRRHEKIIDDIRKYALTDFSVAVTEVRDCLETAMGSKDEGDSFRDGVALTLRKLISIMDERHIFPIKPVVGAPFDPNLHLAIGTAPISEQAPADTVATVVQAGYMLNGRILRPAKTLVAKNIENKPKNGKE